MNMNKSLVLAAFAAVAFVSQPVSAGLVIQVDPNGGSAPTLSNKVNFDELGAGSSAAAIVNLTNGFLSDLTVSFDGGAQVATLPNVPGEYAAPNLSGDNGKGFANGGGDQANGQDATPYLTTGTGTVTLSFTTGQMFFGLLWGSVDTHNTLTFFDADDNLVGTLTGVDIAGALATGDQGAAGTYYVNISSDTAFYSVKATSTSKAFEFDNVAYHSEPLTVPDGGLTLALLGLGLSGLGLIRRRF